MLEAAQAPGAGANRDLGLGEGRGDEEYLAVLGAALDVIGSSRAAGLVVSLGLDIYQPDPMIAKGGHYLPGAGIPAPGSRLLLLRERFHDH